MKGMLHLLPGWEASGFRASHWSLGGSWLSFWGQHFLWARDRGRRWGVAAFGLVFVWGRLLLSPGQILKGGAVLAGQECHPLGSLPLPAE